ncbi:MAG: tetratricopeptide repeat protein [Gammaproteobacteria bacterium]
MQNPANPIKAALFYYESAIIVRNCKEFDVAIDDYRQAIKIDPNFVEAKQGLEKLLLDLGKVKAFISGPFCDIEKMKYKDIENIDIAGESKRNAEELSKLERPYAQEIEPHIQTAISKYQVLLNQTSKKPFHNLVCELTLRLLEDFKKPENTASVSTIPTSSSSSMSSSSSAMFSSNSGGGSSSTQGQQPGNAPHGFGSSK